MTGPTPETEASRSSVSRQAEEPRMASSISVSTLTSSFSSALTSRVMLFLRCREIARFSRRRRKMRDHGSIDRIGLGALSERFRKGANLRRIHDNDRKAGAAKRRGGNGLEATGGLQRHDGGRGWRKPHGQPCQPRTVALHRERLTTRMNGNVQTILRNVNANSDDIHGHPSLPNRASHFAAQATVRVQWTDGRGTSLTHGLQRPWGLRTPVRHRICNNSRLADFRLTRGSGPSIERNPSPGSHLAMRRSRSFASAFFPRTAAI